MSYYKDEQNHWHVGWDRDLKVFYIEPPLTGWENVGPVSDEWFESLTEAFEYIEDQYRQAPATESPVRRLIPEEWSDFPVAPPPVTVPAYVPKDQRAPEPAVEPQRTYSPGENVPHLHIVNPIADQDTEAQRARKEAYAEMVGFK